VTVKRLRQEIDLPEMVDWLGFWRYEAALRDQAREKVEMEREAARETAQRKGPQRRQR
jgi:hypothetical protein